MLTTLVALAVSVALFLWVLNPLFGRPESLAPCEAEDEIGESVARSIQEFRADLELGKIGPEDLAAIEEHLRASASDRRA